MYMSSDGKSLEFVGNMLERKHLSKLKPVLEVSYYQESWGGGGGWKLCFSVCLGVGNRMTSKKT